MKNGLDTKPILYNQFDYHFLKKKNPIKTEPKRNKFHIKIKSYMSFIIKHFFH